MAKLPKWVRDGWRRNGPGHANCPDCRKLVSTNALARASHIRACTGSPEARHQKDGK